MCTLVLKTQETAEYYSILRKFFQNLNLILISLNPTENYRFLEGASV